MLNPDYGMKLAPTRPDLRYLADQIVKDDCAAHRKSVIEFECFRRTAHLSSFGRSAWRSYQWTRYLEKWEREKGKDD